MDKEKEVIALSKVICNQGVDGTCTICKKKGNNDSCAFSDRIAEIVIGTGYRKADEVRKERTKEIFEKLIEVANREHICGHPNPNYGFVPIGTLNALAIEYDVEVDK